MWCGSIGFPAQMQRRFLCSFIPCVCVVLAVITATAATTCFLLLSLSQVMMVQNKLYSSAQVRLIVGHQIGYCSHFLTFTSASPKLSFSSIFDMFQIYTHICVLSSPSSSSFITGWCFRSGDTGRWCRWPGGRCCWWRRGRWRRRRTRWTPRGKGGPEIRNSFANTNKYEYPANHIQPKEKECALQLQLLADFYSGHSGAHATRELSSWVRTLVPCTYQLLCNVLSHQYHLQTLFLHLSTTIITKSFICIVCRANFLTFQYSYALIAVCPQGGNPWWVQQGCQRGQSWWSTPHWACWEHHTAIDST